MQTFSFSLKKVSPLCELFIPIGYDVAKWILFKHNHGLKPYFFSYYRQNEDDPHFKFIVTVDVTSSKRIKGSQLNDILRTQIKDYSKIGEYTIEMDSNYNFRTMEGKYTKGKQKFLYNRVFHAHYIISNQYSIIHTYIQWDTFTIYIMCIFHG